MNDQEKLKELKELEKQYGKLPEFRAVLFLCEERIKGNTNTPHYKIINDLVSLVMEFILSRAFNQKDPKFFKEVLTENREIFESMLGEEDTKIIDKIFSKYITLQ